MDNEIYAKNISIIKSRFPYLYNILQTPLQLPFKYEQFYEINGQLNLIAIMDDGRKVPFYEEDDINHQFLKELKAWEPRQYDLIFFIGLGLGYQPLAALKTYVERTPNIVLIEKNISAFNLAIQHIDLSELLLFDRIDIFVGDDFSADDISAHYALHYRIAKCSFISHYQSRKIFGSAFTDFEKEIKEKVNAYIISWNTMRTKGRQAFSNCIKNLPSVFKSFPFNELRDKFKDIPAVCIGAGPSAMDCLPYIKEINNTSIIIATDTSVKGLIENNIHPHVIVTLDYQDINHEKLRHYLYELKNSLLLYNLPVFPYNTSLFPSSKRSVVSTEHFLLKDWMFKGLGLADKTPFSAGSVGNAAISVAIHLGADPIVMVGMDLSFPGGLDHYKGSMIRANIEEITHTNGSSGGLVLSNIAMTSYKTSLEKIVEIYDQREFVNTCLNGAFINGATIKPIHEIVETCKTNLDISIPDRIDEIDWKNRFALNDYLDIIDNTLLNLKSFIMYMASCFKGLQERQRKPKNTINHSHHNIWMISQIEEKYGDLLYIIQSLHEEKFVELSRINYQLKLSTDIEKISNVDKYLEYISFLKESGEFFLKRLAPLKDYVDQWNEYEAKGDKANPIDNLEMARIHANYDQLWIAEICYDIYLKYKPEDEAVHSELCHLYYNYRLWRPFLERLNSMKRYFGLTPLTKNLEELFIKKKKEIHDSIETDIQMKDYNKARLGIIEHTFMDDEDTDRWNLENIIDRQEDTIKKGSSLFDKYVTKQGEGLPAKAKALVEAGRFEASIGIYTSLTLKEGGIKYHEDIGDIRLIQHKFTSALWNYQHLYKNIKGNDVNKDVISGKIKLSQLLSSGTAINKQRQLQLSIIVFNPGHRKCNIDQIRNIEFSKSQEIIVINDNNIQFKSEFDSLQTMKHVNFDNKLMPKALNSAILISAGEFIFFIDVNLIKYIDCNDIESLMDCLKNKDNVGCVSPIPASISEFDSSNSIVEHTSNEFQNQKWHEYKEQYGKKWKHRRLDSDWILENCFMCGFSLFRDIGLFDEQHSNEFSDTIRGFCQRALLEGYHHFLVADLPVPLVNLRYDFKAKGNCQNEATDKINNISIIDSKLFLITAMENAKIEYHRENLTNSIAIISDAIKKYPYDKRLYLTLSEILIDAREYELALSLLKKMPQNRRDINRKILEGFCHEGLGQVDLAEERLVSALFMKKSPFPDALKLKGLIMFGREKIDRAVEAFSMAIELDHGYGDAYTNLGLMAWEKEGKKEEALSYLERGFILNPTASASYKNYHNAISAMGLYEQAEPLFREATVWHPFHKNLHYLYVDVLIKLDKNSQALLIIDKIKKNIVIEEGLLDAEHSLKNKIMIHH